MSARNEGDRWFLAQLKPNCGRIAERSLQQQGFETFMPWENGVSRAKGKLVDAARPLFPGYIFVAFDIAAGPWRSINSTNGVARLVSFGTDPTPVPREVMDELARRCDASGKLLPPDSLQPGDEVALTSGPLAGLVGVIQSIAPERRVWVLLEIMGGRTRVAVSVDQVKVAHK